MRSLPGWLKIVALVAVLGGALALAVVKAQELPTGPVAVVWDKEPCAHCHMHVGIPAYAAQLQLADGRVLNFDDPGCLIAYQEEHASESVHAVYVHHWKEDRWLTQQETAFVSASPTPMGYGIGAVPAGTQGALPWDDARAQVLLRKAAAP